KAPDSNCSGLLCFIHDLLNLGAFGYTTKCCLQPVIYFILVHTIVGLFGEFSFKIPGQIKVYFVVSLSIERSCPSFNILISACCDNYLPLV
ncbi:MAG: hypothetical protein ABJA78_20620, partial [Ferruginibacter sp.]